MTADPEQIKVLIIDDENAIRESFSDFLEDCGYITETAQNGTRGVELFNDINPDIVLIDLRMPEMDGLQVLRKLTPLSPGTPFIVISGAGMIADAVQAMKYGAWDYLFKPVKDLEILEQTINKVLEKAWLQKELKRYHDELEMMVETRTQQLQKKTEELEMLLAEKDVLIQEVHHRVKNNMSIIISMMSLKSGMLKNSEAKRILIDCENRIRAMALVHEKLYRNNNIRLIRADEYIYDLTAEVLSNNSDIISNVRLETDVDDSCLNISILLYLGLIINEIITNSIKYAFDGINEPLIRISLKTAGNHSILQFSDNGTGIHENEKALRDNPVGIQLIELLTAQIEGEFEIRSGNGTEYIIRIPRPPA